MMDSRKLFDLTGRTVILTGGAGLLGQQFARILFSAGASVVIADLDGDRAISVAEMIDGSKKRAIAYQVDITSQDDVNGLVEATMSQFQEIDVLVNSAALDPKFDHEHAAQHSNAFEEFPLSAWNDALAVNLTGMFLITQAVSRQMLAQGQGVVINICSTYGLVGPDQRIYQCEGESPRYKPVYYSVTKAAVLGFTRYLAAYYAGRNIRVNALSPGGVFNEHDDDFVQKYSARTILGRMASKDEMNGAILFLASDASSYMTGANLVVDGGWTAW
jgi:NAD(P)-dependent dehydrogenase (short-subunit alcohol dehydrogenase family)